MLSQRHLEFLLSPVSVNMSEALTLHLNKYAQVSVSLTAQHTAQQHSMSAIKASDPAGRANAEHKHPTRAANGAHLGQIPPLMNQSEPHDVYCKITKYWSVVAALKARVHLRERACWFRGRTHNWEVLTHQKSWGKVKKYKGDASKLCAHTVQATSAVCGPHINSLERFAGLKNNNEYTVLSPCLPAPQCACTHLGIKCYEQDMELF